MAALALDGRADVRLVRKEGELGNLKHPHPGNRRAPRRERLDLGDLGVIARADDLVAAETSLERRHPRVLRATRVGVAVLTGNLKRASVDRVIEEDRLLR